MKTTYAYPAKNRSVSLPNAATRRQVIQRVLDSLLMAASGAGLGAAILLLLVLL